MYQEKREFNHRRILAAFAASMVVSGLLFVGSPASAVTERINGTQNGDSTAFYGTKRTNTLPYAKTSVKVIYRGSDWNGSSLTFGMRSALAESASFAKTTALGNNSSAPFRHVSHQSTVLGPGSFYLTVSATGCMGPLTSNCGGGPGRRGSGTFSADLMFNLP